MANELTKTEQGFLATSGNTDLGDIIKPFIREIHLFDTYVAGVTHLKDKTVLDEIKVDDTLILRREDNKYDSNAVIIFTENKKKLGYVPRVDNIIFARLMDAGKILKAKINGIDTKGSYTQIGIGIYLVDI